MRQNYFSTLLIVKVITSKDQAIRKGQFLNLENFDDFWTFSHLGIIHERPVAAGSPESLVTVPTTPNFSTRITFKKNFLVSPKNTQLRSDWSRVTTL